MNRDQVLDLLSVAVAYDNRNPTEAQVLAWCEAAQRGRWTFAEALDALHEHYARTTDFVMPGHITEAVRARRNQPPPPRAALGGPAPAGAGHIDAVVGQLAGKLGWRTEEGDGTRRRAVLAQPCGYCGAQPSQPCTRPSTRAEAGSVPTGFHPSRVEAAGEAR